MRDEFTLDGSPDFCTEDPAQREDWARLGAVLVPTLTAAAGPGADAEPAALPDLWVPVPSGTDDAEPEPLPAHVVRRWAAETMLWVPVETPVTRRAEVGVAAAGLASAVEERAEPWPEISSAASKVMAEFQSTATAPAALVERPDQMSTDAQVGRVSGIHLLTPDIINYDAERLSATSNALPIPILFFDGAALRVTDGTTAGTVFLANTSGPSLHEFLSDGRMLFFNGGLDIWITDGSPSGTFEIQVTEAARYWNPYIASLGNGTALFNRLDDGSGHELWITDGTIAGTRRIADIKPGSGGSNPSHLQPIGQEMVLFVANDGIHGYELWVSDGSASGTRLLRDILPGTMGSISYSNVDVWNVWFRSGRLSSDLIAFVAFDIEHGNELWVTDGTSAGTRLLRDIAPGTASSMSQYYPNPYLCSTGDGRVLFVADDGVHGSELWITDGTSAGTRMVRDINPSENGTGISEITALGDGRAVFSAHDGVHGFELWITDGTSAGTSMVADIGPGSDWNTSGSPTAITSLGDGRALFIANDVTHGREFWVTDGTSAGTRLVRDINPGAGSANIHWQITALGDGRALFNASSSGHWSGVQTWITDGTEAGTRVASEVLPGFPQYGSGFTLFPGGGRPGRTLAQELEYLARVTAYEGNLQDGGRVLDRFTIDAVFAQGTFQAIGLVSDSGERVLAFRGTSGNLDDWLANGHVRSVGYGELVSQKAALLAWLATGTPAHITGHSQGGAQAQTVAAWATEAGTQIGRLSTFNAPGIAAADVGKFNTGLAGAVTHFISRGDVVSMVGRDYIPGSVTYYDFDALGFFEVPFALIGKAHSGHWTSAAVAAQFPGVFDDQPTDIRNAGLLDSTALGSAFFSHLTAGDGFDTEYFRLLHSISMAASILPTPLAIAGATIAAGLAQRVSAEGLRVTFGPTLFTAITVLRAIESVSLAIQNVIDAAIETVLSWGARGVEIVLNWSAAIWEEVAGFTVQTWRGLKDLGADALDALADGSRWLYQNIREAGAQGVEALVNLVNLLRDGAVELHERLLDTRDAMYWATKNGLNAILNPDPDGNIFVTTPSVAVAGSDGARINSTVQGTMIVTGAGQDTVSLTTGNNVIFGLPSSLHQDRVSGFGNADALLLLGQALPNRAIIFRAPAQNAPFAQGDAAAAANGSRIEIDTDGDGIADTVIELEGAYDPSRFKVIREGGNTVILYGTPTFVGTNAADALAGSARDDILRGGRGGDTLQGEFGDDTIQGGSGPDWLFGGAGDDLVVGGAGNDRIDGGDGWDTVVFGQVPITVDLRLTGVQETGEGNDRLRNVEHVTTGDGNDSVTGNLHANRLISGRGDDTLSGLGGKDTLLGEGGNDRLDGGDDHDVLDGGDGDDRLSGGDGDDSLLGGTGVDELLGGLGNDTLEGGDGNDRLVGGEGSDLLSGGSGDDTLLGGAGDDSYVVDGVGDRVFETTTMNSGVDAGGIDTVQSAVTFSLDTGAGVRFVEHLVLTGAGNIRGTGNALDNWLTGNDGNNVLDGGLGADTMIGGSGNDIYIVESSADRVFETTTMAGALDAGGVDTVRSAVSFNLDSSAGVRFVEHLVLTGTGNTNGTGNALANRLTGNAGNNVLNGRSGNDTLTGGAGRDSFVFSTAPGPGNIDRITDFSAADDTIRLDDAVFAGLVVGALAPEAFASNLTGQAATTSHRIIHETDTGRLFFDSDGSGSAARIQFATLSLGLTLTHQDFVVF